MTFTWYFALSDGTAMPFEDCPELSAQINRAPAGWYGSIEGAILHGGVQAVAVTRKTEMTYDTKAWLETGKMVPAGLITITKITAEPKR